MFNEQGAFAPYHLINNYNLVTPGGIKDTHPPAARLFLSGHNQIRILVQKLAQCIKIFRLRASNGFFPFHLGISKIFHFLIIN
jgi:hypothetical protein